MTDPAYTVIGQVDLAQGDSPSPYGAPANVILDDGSFFVAVWWSSGTDAIRMWHLGSDLSVLGTADIALSGSQWPTPYAVAISGMKVLLVSQTGWDNSLRVGTAWSSWIVDCSSGEPVAGAMQAQATGYDVQYNLMGFGVCHFYDQVTDRVLIATTAAPVVILQVFKASTGVLLHEISSGVGSYPIGLYMDPADSTKFTLCVADGSYDAAHYAFTVALDGMSGSYDGTTVTHTGSQTPVAGGSPYLAGGGGTVVEQWPSDNFLNYYSSGPEVSHDEGQTGLNQYGSMATLANDRDLLAINEVYDSSLGRDFYYARLIAVDQLAVPPVMEILDLPYAGSQFTPSVAPGDYPDSPPTSETCPPIISADTSSGIVLVSTTVYSYFYTSAPYSYSLLVWVIQGPTDKPNLKGGPLGVDVYFSGG